MKFITFEFTFKSHQNSNIIKNQKMQNIIWLFIQTKNETDFFIHNDHRIIIPLEK